MGGVGEMSEWILHFRNRTKPIIYFLRGVAQPSGRLESGCQKKREISTAKLKAFRYTYVGRPNNPIKTERHLGSSRTMSPLVSDVTDYVSCCRVQTRHAVERQCALCVGICSTIESLPSFLYWFRHVLRLPRDFLCPPTKRYCDRSACPSVRPSVSLSHTSISKTVRFKLLWSTNKRPMLKVEPTGQRGPMTTGSGRNGDLHICVVSILKRWEIELWLLWLLLNTNRKSRTAYRLP